MEQAGIGTAGGAAGGRLVRVLGLGALAASAVAGLRCGPGARAERPAPDLADPAIRTDRREYGIRYGEARGERFVDVPIGWRYTNRTAGPVYLAGCGIPEPTPEKWVAGRWVAAYQPIRLLCLAPPTVLGPGAAHADTLGFTAGLPGSTAVGPELEVAEIPGTYRLVWEVYGDWVPDTAGGHLWGRPGRLVPLEERASNTFRLAGRCNAAPPSLEWLRRQCSNP